MVANEHVAVLIWLFTAVWLYSVCQIFSWTLNTESEHRFVGHVIRSRRNYGWGVLNVTTVLKKKLLRFLRTELVACGL